MPRGEHLNKPGGAATRETRAKGAHAANKARTEKRERLIRLAEEKLENALDSAIDVYVDGLKAGVVTVAETDDGQEIIDTDHRTRISAADRIADRAMGKPVQRTELTGAGGGPVVLENDVSPDSAAAILAGLGGRVGIGPGHAANGDAAPDEVHSA